ncbi:MAG: hypothetical protein VZR27_12535 [Acutalibacteraceae bacterium]|nr:hypothetical protein [Acutalibacteraceae bacterium]
MNNPYGYRVDITKPKCRELYERYKEWKGIPRWCPLSDSERLEFERYVLGETKGVKKQ